jgi:hypothetical protein
MDWKVALKHGGPAVLAVWGFYHLIVSYINTSTIFKNDFWLNILVLTYIFVFFLVMAWLWLRKPILTDGAKRQVHDNEVNDNEVLGSLDVKSSSIINNKISGNKVDGSLNIGD